MSFLLPCGDGKEGSLAAKTLSTLSFRFSGTVFVFSQMFFEELAVPMIGRSLQETVSAPGFSLLSKTIDTTIDAKVESNTKMRTISLI